VSGSLLTIFVNSMRWMLRVGFIVDQLRRCHAEDAFPKVEAHAMDFSEEIFIVVGTTLCWHLPKSLLQSKFWHEWRGRWEEASNWSCLYKVFGFIFFIQKNLSANIYCIFAYNYAKFVDDIDKHEITVKKGESLHVKVEPFLA